MKKIINSKNGPPALGTYSHAVQVNNLLYISGQIGIESSTGELISDHFAEQIFTNLENIATAAGGDLTNIIKFNVYLIDLKNFDILNNVFANYLKVPFLARAAVEVQALPKGAKVEIEAVAALD